LKQRTSGHKWDGEKKRERIPKVIKGKTLRFGAVGFGQRPTKPRVIHPGCGMERNAPAKMKWVFHSKGGGGKGQGVTTNQFGERKTTLQKQVKSRVKCGEGGGGKRSKLGKIKKKQPERDGPMGTEKAR